MLFVFIAALTFDADAIVGQLQFHIVLSHSGEIGPDDQVIIALKHFDLRRPTPADQIRRTGSQRSAELPNRRAHRGKDIDSLQLPTSKFLSLAGNARCARS